MNKQFHITGLALLAVAICGSNADAEEKFQKLNAGQIRAKLAGMELTDNVHWRDLYQRNGTVVSTSMGRKRTGKWRMEEDHCASSLRKSRYRSVTTCGSLENRSSCGAKVYCHCREQ